MLSLTVRIGQAVQLGDVAVVKVEDKSGRRVRLTFATTVSPISLIPDGIIPRRFAVGLGDQPRRILEAVPEQRAVA